MTHYTVDARHVRRAGPTSARVCANCVAFYKARGVDVSGWHVVTSAGYLQEQAKRERLLRKEARQAARKGVQA